MIVRPEHDRRPLGLRPLSRHKRVVTSRRISHPQRWDGEWTPSHSPQLPQPMGGPMPRAESPDTTDALEHDPPPRLAPWPPRTAAILPDDEPLRHPCL